MHKLKCNRGDSWCVQVCQTEYVRLSWAVETPRAVHESRIGGRLYQRFVVVVLTCVVLGRGRVCVNCVSEHVASGNRLCYDALRIICAGSSSGLACDMQLVAPAAAEAARQQLM
jgi:hypothetical protein